MEGVIVRYAVKPDRVAVNEGLVRAVYRELHDARPAGLRYATFKLADGVSFVHLATTEPGVASPLPGLAAFREFQQGIRDRCDEPPVVTGFEQIGAFRLLGDR